MPFLTSLDDRAKVKGSRDPLGLQTIWTRFGRHVVGNLTTVSNSVRDFTELLVGLYFAERAIDADREASELDIFLRWEQLASYARFKVNHDFRFRGTERVARTLNEGTRVRLSLDPHWQILGDQRNYGLWGLFMVPARTSGLIEPTMPRLTLVAKRFVEANYVADFGKRGAPSEDRVAAMLAQPEKIIDLDTRDAPLLTAVASILQRRVLVRERTFYQDHLLNGGSRDSTNGLQAQLAHLLEPTLRDETFALRPATLDALIAEARTRFSRDSQIVDRLVRIRVCESLIALASHTFGYLLTQDGKLVSMVAKTLRDQWGARLRSVDIAQVAAVEDELADPSIKEESRIRWHALAGAYETGDYADCIRLLADQNRVVMNSRGAGNAWLEIDQGRVKVRLRDESGSLPAEEDLAQLWRFPYFIDSLRSIARDLRI